MPRWTEQSRQLQRELIQKQKPWRKSKGPVTPYGKQVASRNAVKKKRTLSQQLHFGFTPPCENVTSVSSAQESYTERPLEIDDRVTYLGGYEPTMLACGNESMVVAGFCQLGTGAIACRTAGGKIVWIYSKDLERV